MFDQTLGFSNGCAELALKKPPPLSPISLIGFLAGDRTQRHDLLCAFERRRFDRSAQRLRYAERHEEERNDDRQRHEHIERRARHIDPEIADGWRFPPRQRSRQRDRHRGRRRRIEEVVGRQADHLRKVAKCRLAGISLPVGVGDEADRDVEGEVGRHARKALRVEWQIGLQSQQRVEAQHAGAAKDHHRDRILEPLLLGLRVDPRRAIERALDRANDRSEKSPAILEQIRHEGAERIGCDKNKRERQRDFE